MKIALVQFHSFLSSPIYNAQRHLHFIQKARDQSADLIVFPELSLCSYPLYDLPENKKLIQDQNIALDFLLSSLPDNISVLVGGLSPNAGQGKAFFNSAFLLVKGRMVKTFSKKLIPNYDIFDEYRFIEPAPMDSSSSEFSIGSTNFLLHICEDSWFGVDSFYQRSLYSVSSNFIEPKNTLDYVINMSASPFFQGKRDNRLNMAKNVTSTFKAKLLYVNSVGASDEVIFDGRSFVYGPDQGVLLEAKPFEEEFLFIDTQREKNKNSTLKNITKPVFNLSPQLVKGAALNNVRQALCFGLKNFIKQSGFSKVHLGLSGGVDSAVMACLAVEALGESNVSVLSLPSQFSSQLSFDLALDQAKLLSLELKNISIEEIFQVCKSTIDLSLGISEFSVIHENIQARLRSLILMAYSQKENSLLLNTSNKSEIAVGYSTLYGDMSGALSPIGDLLKTEVCSLAEYYVGKKQLSQAVIDRAPTAELRENQRDQDSLPEYKALDFVIMKILNIKKSSILDDQFQGSFAAHISKNYSKEDLCEIEQFCRTKINQSEFKRFQSPPILKVSEKSFGQGRKMPVANVDLFKKK